MIKIEPYTKEFEEIYWNAVREKISSSTQHNVLSSSQQFLPKDFWGGQEPTFQHLILAPFEKLKKAQQHIKVFPPSNVMTDHRNHDQSAQEIWIHFCRELADAYPSVANSKKNGYSMRVRIVKNSRLTICPYCNRDYINSRGESASGAELDHFFSKSAYPVFSLCLYNLVPVCGNCNRMKSQKEGNFASPFDEGIDWEQNVIFHYEPDIGNQAKIVLKSENEAVQNNIEAMRIKEAYQIHEVELEELLEKKRSYSKTQRQEFQEVLYQTDLSEQEIKLAVFGPKITMDTMRTRSLGKMMSDLHKQL